MINGKIQLPDGSIEFVRDPNDLVRIIKDRMGHDAAEMVRELTDLADDIQQRLESDLSNYEIQLDSQTAALREINSSVHHLLNIVHRAKIAKTEKEAILRSLEAIRTELKNHI